MSEKDISGKPETWLTRTMVPAGDGTFKPVPTISEQLAELQARGMSEHLDGVFGTAQLRRTHYIAMYNDPGSIGDRAQELAREQRAQRAQARIEARARTRTLKKEQVDRSGVSGEIRSDANLSLATVEFVARILFNGTDILAEKDYSKNRLTRRAQEWGAPQSVRIDPVPQQSAVGKQHHRRRQWRH